MNNIQLCKKCRTAYSPIAINGVGVLQNLKGYTIDIRLQQFRKIPFDGLPEFIAFDSKEGMELLEQMHVAVAN